jgi:hypothetical protein
MDCYLSSSSMALVEDSLELEILFVERRFLVTGSSYGGEQLIYKCTWCAVIICSRTVST